MKVDTSKRGLKVAAWGLAVLLAMTIAELIFGL